MLNAKLAVILKKIGQSHSFIAQCSEEQDVVRRDLGTFVRYRFQGMARAKRAPQEPLSFQPQFVLPEEAHAIPFACFAEKSLSTAQFLLFGALLRLFSLYLHNAEIGLGKFLSL